jgi:RNase P/RNase MRP subunit p29
MNVYNNNWLGKTLNVISSLDNTLVGRQGMVVDESQKNYHHQRGWQDG